MLRLIIPAGGTEWGGGHRRRWRYMRQETENLYVNGPSIDQLVSGHVSHYSGGGV